jgi:hypothetical protein
LGIGGECTIPAPPPSVVVEPRVSPENPGHLAQIYDHGIFYAIIVRKHLPDLTVTPNSLLLAYEEK